jgi:DNA-binding GntR family transcriptional regulator
MTQEVVPVVAAAIALVAASRAVVGYPVPVKPVKVQTKGEAAYTEVKARILDGSLRPGSPINQRTLASALSISIIPLREALKRLEGEGLVEASSDKAATVATLTPSELHQLRVVRLQLEPLAASLAASSGTREQRASLTRLASMTPTSNVELWHEADGIFHRAVHTMAANKVLSEVLSQLWLRLDRYRLIAASDPDVNRSSSTEHATIARAIQNGDCAGAARLMSGHLGASSEAASQMTPQPFGDLRASGA